MMGKSYWDYLDYLEGEHEEAPMILEQNSTLAHVKAFKDWNQGAKKVMH